MKNFRHIEGQVATFVKDAAVLPDPHSLNELLARKRKLNGLVEAGVKGQFSRVLAILHQVQGKVAELTGVSAQVKAAVERGLGEAQHLLQEDTAALQEVWTRKSVLEVKTDSCFVGRIKELLKESERSKRKMFAGHRECLSSSRLQQAEGRAWKNSSCELLLKELDSLIHRASLGMSEQALHAEKSKVFKGLEESMKGHRHTTDAYLRELKQESREKTKLLNEYVQKFERLQRDYQEYQEQYRDLSQSFREQAGLISTEHAKQLLEQVATRCLTQFKHFSQRLSVKCEGVSTRLQSLARGPNKISEWTGEREVLLKHFATVQRDYMALTENMEYFTQFTEEFQKLRQSNEQLKHSLAQLQDQNSEVKQEFDEYKQVWSPHCINESLDRAGQLEVQLENLLEVNQELRKTIREREDTISILEEHAAEARSEENQLNTLNFITEKDLLLEELQLKLSELLKSQQILQNQLTIANEELQDSSAKNQALHEKVLNEHMSKEKLLQQLFASRQTIQELENELAQTQQLFTRQQTECHQLKHYSSTLEALVKETSPSKSLHEAQFDSLRPSPFKSTAYSGSITEPAVVDLIEDYFTEFTYQCESLLGQFHSKHATLSSRVAELSSKLIQFHT